MNVDAWCALARTSDRRQRPSGHNPFGAAEIAGRLQGFPMEPVTEGLSIR